MNGADAPSSLFLELPCANDESPHSFEAHRFDVRGALDEVAARFLEAWHVEADAFFDRIASTGFDGGATKRIINQAGLGRLPATPSAEDAEVTRDISVTSLTEVLALVALGRLKPFLLFPYPRALHSEVPRLQHHGIDMLAYGQPDGEENVLYIIEVMASVSASHPPTTVTEHRDQLMEQTLDAPEPSRLMDDLCTVHAESSDHHKDSLNGFIVSLVDGSLSNSNRVRAVPVLVRRNTEFDERDWQPFRNACGDFTAARISSRVCAVALEACDSFCDLLDEVKAHIAAVELPDLDAD